MKMNATCDKSFGAPDSTTIALAISVSLLLVFFIAAVVIIGVLWKRYRNAKANVLHLVEVEMEEPNTENEGTAEHSAFNANKIIPSECIVKYDEILGEGPHRIVFKGTYNDPVVAIKTAKTTNDTSYLIDFLRELKHMDYIGDHERIVGFHGGVVDKIKYKNCLAVMEYCPQGSLKKYLEANSANYQRAVVDPAVVANISGNTDGQFTKAKLLEFCVQIANGMEYLAQKKIIHRDLATKNILVFEGNRVKISDFRQCRQLYEGLRYVEGGKGPFPWRWMAIESLRLHYREFSTMSDVWSYGVTLWEIFTLGQLPYCGFSWNVKFIEELKNGFRLSKPQYAPPEIYELMLRCWEEDASERPDFTELKRFFQDYAQRNSQPLSQNPE